MQRWSGNPLKKQISFQRQLSNSPWEGAVAVSGADDGQCWIQPLERVWGWFFFLYTEGIFIFPQLRALWQHRVNSHNLPSLSAGVSLLTKTLRCANTGSEHEIKNVFTLLVCFISSIDFLIERPQDLCYRAEQLCRKAHVFQRLFPCALLGKFPELGGLNPDFSAGKAAWCCVSTGKCDYSCPFQGLGAAWDSEKSMAGFWKDELKYPFQPFPNIVCMHCLFTTNYL